MASRSGSILVVNCGSSSLQLDLVDEHDEEHRVLRLDEALTADNTRSLTDALDELTTPPAAVAHRFVHGGRDRGPNLLDESELGRLESLAWLAPLHLPPAIAAARALADHFPGIPAHACFDTAFHAHLDPASRTLPLPARWRDEHGFERLGFHGPGHQWAGERTAALLGRAPEELGIVTVHLGGGASASAVRGGRSVDTTMAFTPLAGAAMTTRPGSVDPGVLLRLFDTGSTVEQLTEEVNREAGMAAVSGTTGDLRRLYPLADDGDARARLAIDVYVRGIAQAIAAMATSLARVDAVAFTGGAGSGSPRLRAEVCGRLVVLGVRLDQKRNAAALDVDALVHHALSGVPMAVVHAREATVLARSVRDVLDNHPAPSPRPTPG